MNRLLGIVLVLSFTQTAIAQVSPVEAKTIELKHLKPAEAVKLLRPYIVNAGGGVYDVADKLPIITIKDVPENIAKMEKVLAKYDHSPATIRLVFQLIEADTGTRMLNASNQRGTQLSVDLDSTLRSVLRFPSYRLLAQGVATAGEFAWVTQQLANAEAGSTYDLNAEIGTVRVDDPGRSGGPLIIIDGVAVDTSAKGTVHVNVSLSKTNSLIVSGGNASRPSERIISTGLDVPFGTMVVLGTAATRSGAAALILTVKPELVRAK